MVDGVHIEFRSEEHCDECHEIDHTHMERCPACGKVNAGTSIYGPIWEEEKPIQLTCEECGAVFECEGDWDPLIYPTDAGSGQWKRVS